MAPERQSVIPLKRWLPLAGEKSIHHRPAILCFVMTSTLMGYDMIDLSAPCITGSGEFTRLGYIRLWNGGNRILAHRAAFIKEYGPIPDGLEIDHLCHNRSCVNLLHLQLATHKQNSRRKVNSKLTMQDAEKIRSMRLTGLSLQKISDSFGVSKQMIWRIVQCKSWS